MNVISLDLLENESDIKLMITIPIITRIYEEEGN